MRIFFSVTIILVSMLSAASAQAVKLPRTVKIQIGKYSEVLTNQTTGETKENWTAKTSGTVSHVWFEKPRADVLFFMAVDFNGAKKKNISFNWGFANEAKVLSQLLQWDFVEEIKAEEVHYSAVSFKKVILRNKRVMNSFDLGMLAYSNSGMNLRGQDDKRYINLALLMQLLPSEESKSALLKLINVSGDSIAKNQYDFLDSVVSYELVDKLMMPINTSKPEMPIRD